MASKKRKYRQTFASTMGGPLVGFDHEDFRTMPPPKELVHAGEDARPLSGESGELDHELEIPPADDLAREPADEGRRGRR